ncbi:hypothetical protein [Kitasatospora purpeofusca]|uniref:hypothetical protein n=1 Tax=Kitasatospora purpeofusca TaxID=67352 RepID=UPI002A59CE7D|nr:hypothetical protein [Kitasatospora purpeofusca]MDY0816718.1 hypothetical protein [Kitasatospora purpeofusca]
MGRVLTSVLLGAVVAVVCALLAPTAWAQASMTLSPDHGPRGSRVTVDGTGFTSCLPVVKSLPATVQLLWDTTPAATAPLDTNGHFQGSVDVPANAEPRPHLVRATCRIVRSPATPGLVADVVSVSRDFVVDPDTPQSLALTPASGPVGRPFTARGTGFACPDGEPVVLRWEQRELGRAQPYDGAFEQSVTVPAGAAPGTHPVEASCGPAAERRATATFTVVPSGSGSPTGGTSPDPTDASPTTGPVLRVQPGRARPGQQVVLTGTGFACRGAEAELTWNDVVWEHVGTGTAGGFVLTTRIADDARPGHYRLRAVCPDRPGTAGSTEFEVLTADGGPAPGGGDAAPTALVVGSTAGGAVVLAALAGTYVLGRRRGPHWASAHVAVAPVAGEPPRPLVTETDDPAGPGRTVRLESREEPGTHRVEETPRHGTPGGETGTGGTGGRGTGTGETRAGETPGAETRAEEGEATEEDP